MAVDWLKIKSEYVNGNISLRNLAEKCGVSYSTLAKVAANERWSELRESQRIKTESKTNQKTQEKISDALSDEAAAKVKIRAGLVKLAADWVSSQEKIEDTNDFRRMVQSCCDLGIMEVQDGGGTEDDGLISALGSSASGFFADGDDGDLMTEEDDA